MTFLYHTTDRVTLTMKNQALYYCNQANYENIVYIFFVCWIGDDMKCQR